METSRVRRMFSFRQVENIDNNHILILERTLLRLHQIKIKRKEKSADRLEEEFSSSLIEWEESTNKLGYKSTPIRAAWKFLFKASWLSVSKKQWSEKQ